MIKSHQVITAERFDDMQNMMYPMKWNCSPSQETFMYPEPYDINIHYAYIRIEDKYVECLASTTETSVSLINSAREFLLSAEGAK